MQIRNVQYGLCLSPHPQALYHILSHLSESKLQVLYPEVYVRLPSFHPHHYHHLYGPNHQNHQDPHIHQHISPP